MLRTGGKPSSWFPPGTLVEILATKLIRRTTEVPKLSREEKLNV